MWDCCCESMRKIEKSAGSGCILAHCMGLGKTLQVRRSTKTNAFEKQINTEETQNENHLKKATSFFLKGYTDTMIAEFYGKFLLTHCKLAIKAGLNIFFS